MTRRAVILAALTALVAPVWTPFNTLKGGTDRFFKKIRKLKPADFAGPAKWAG